jgi:drug/metabolite transporter (DMT)-like permease
MAVLLALLTAVSYGVGDFSGGLAARRAAPLNVTATSHAAGFLALILLAVIAGANHVRPSDLLLGAAGGVFGCIGIVLLYGGLARGQMAVVSPISAVIAVVVPVVAGLLAGERPGGLALLGIAAAILAVALVSRSGPMGRPDRTSLLTAMGSGIGFGVYFVFIAAIGESSGFWPLVSGRLVSMVIATVLAVGRGLRPLVPRAALELTLAAGLLDVTANAMFLLATQRGLLTIVSVIAALYPAVTVMLAIGIEDERLSKAQGVGLVAAAGALVLITV